MREGRGSTVVEWGEGGGGRGADNENIGRTTRLQIEEGNDSLLHRFVFRLSFMSQSPSLFPSASLDRMYRYMSVCASLCISRLVCVRVRVCVCVLDKCLTESHKLLRGISTASAPSPLPRSLPSPILFSHPLAGRDIMTDDDVVTDDVTAAQTIISSAARFSRQTTFVAACQSPRIDGRRQEQPANTDSIVSEGPR